MRYHFISTRMAKIKASKQQYPIYNNKMLVCKAIGTFLHYWWIHKIEQAPWKTDSFYEIKNIYPMTQQVYTQVFTQEQ